MMHKIKELFNFNYLKFNTKSSLSNFYCFLFGFPTYLQCAGLYTLSGDR